MDLLPTQICVLLAFLGLQFNRKRMATPSNSPWVGNQSSVLTGSDSKNLFSKYCNVQSVKTPNPSSNYAFVYFNQNEDAMPTVKGPRGSVLRGKEIQIDSAKPDQKPHSALNGGNQGKSEVKDDKNQRYLSTLQLAANLLLQRQQKQQQSSNPAGQGSATPKQDLHQLGN